MKVQVYNTMWHRRAAYFFAVPEFHTYQGEEVKVKWLSEHQLALTTDNPELPFRVIDRSLIREIDSRPYEFRRTSAKDTVRLVQGSKGRTYEVTGNYRCTCPGFTFRGRCRHLEENVV